MIDFERALILGRELDAAVRHSRLTRQVDVALEDFGVPQNQEAPLAQRRRHTDCVFHSLCGPGQVHRRGLQVLEQSVLYARGLRIVRIPSTGDLKRERDEDSEQGGAMHVRRQLLRQFEPIAVKLSRRLPHWS